MKQKKQEVEVGERDGVVIERRKAERRKQGEEMGSNSPSILFLLPH